MNNTLHYGDGLCILREMPYASADLICLDPPFNSNRGYNIFFASTKGDSSAATWHRCSSGHFSVTMR